MHSSRYNLALMGVCLLLACSGPTHNADVWDSYDVRHPLPKGSTVPDGYARQYDQYIDNDNYYSMPSCSIMDAPSCGGD